MGPAEVVIAAPRLLAELEARAIARDASLAAVAERDLARYYNVLRRELGHVALTAGELRVVREGLALAGARRRLGHRAPSASLADAAAEACDAGSAGRLGVDGPALVARLRALSPAQELALVDGIERLRKGEAAEGGKAQMERARAMGLVRGEATQGADVDGNLPL